MKSKRFILGILIVVLNITIFGFSNQDGKSSLSLSDSVTSKVIDNYSVLTKKEYSESKKNQLIKNFRPYIRKTAHFTIYFVLGIIVYLFIETFNFKHPILFTLFICLSFASFDEIHQLFSDGRTGRVFDIIIDSFGSLCGAFLSSKIQYKNKIKRG